jgi:hypothetical protein
MLTDREGRVWSLERLGCPCTANELDLMPTCKAEFA